MKRNATVKTIAAAIISVLILGILSLTLFACNDTLSNSKEIFVYDFSETYKISIKVAVKNHTYFPSEYNRFEFSKGIDKLYEKISETTSTARRQGDVIIIDRFADCRKYSCIIYPLSEGSFAIHPMCYTLGEWADNQAIFFPSFTLDKEIKSTDGENETYECSYNIENLQAYYNERGYKADIDGNVLKVVCLL